MRDLHTILMLCCTLGAAQAQPIVVVEDFEGTADDQRSFPNEGIFSYGAISLLADQGPTTGHGYSGHRALRVEWMGTESHGGWGKGVGMYHEIDAERDLFCFHYRSVTGGDDTTRWNILVQEQDHGDGERFDPHRDDLWSVELGLPDDGQWRTVCVPLHAFRDLNPGGDGVFNISHREGRLIAILFQPVEHEKLRRGDAWHFDMLCFARGIDPGLHELWEPTAGKDSVGCMLGAWSEEGDVGDFTGIAERIEDLMDRGTGRRLGLVSLYGAMALDGGLLATHPPPVKELNTLVARGYLPMLTFEAHFPTANGDSIRQPNLYSIVEGWFDPYFADWARRIKQVRGPMLVRILHEFNGDWYPWCIALNDHDPDLYVRAYRHIVDIFREEGAQNVRFVWCPNAMSSPQAPWNFMMDAYPGDAYVDIVGVDVFNGAGQPGTPLWRSFRQLFTESHALLTDRLPHKPLVICEVGSRERMPGEEGHLLGKADWIAELSAALRSDMHAVRQLTWFNQYEGFRIDSSPEAEDAFRRHLWEQPHFSTTDARPLTGP